MAALHPTPKDMAIRSPESAFCRPEEDPFLQLELTLCSIEDVLMRCRDLPLRRYLALSVRFF